MKIQGDRINCRAGKWRGEKGAFCPVFELIDRPRPWKNGEKITNETFLPVRGKNTQNAGAVFQPDFRQAAFQFIEKRGADAGEKTLDFSFPYSMPLMAIASALF
ncbi:MAG: hypothetical protein JRH05_06515 [Deltaproteobacteria bacterium]|nr:hypothetical protein [Deltaproteobacteria bacterium]MBW2102322.1 hypothetical protein [Deltaproteobacteria bacterium]RLB37186.1 MAG: hypothetical protein DRH20_08260 [Deltaproteobacteria bacterium]